jgi:hypothetical protein
VYLETEKGYPNFIGPPVFWKEKKS